MCFVAITSPSYKTKQKKHIQPSESKHESLKLWANLNFQSNLKKRKRLCFPLPKNYNAIMVREEKFP